MTQGYIMTSDRNTHKERMLNISQKAAVGAHLAIGMEYGRLIILHYPT